MRSLVHRAIRPAVLSLVTVALLGTCPASAKSSYDGIWNVSVATKTGVCDHGFRYPVRITDGTLGDAGPGMVQVSGRVRDNGSLTVKMASGAKHAVGSGRLAGNSGSGTWHSATCIGTWTAQKQ